MTSWLGDHEDRDADTRAQSDTALSSLFGTGAMQGDSIGGRFLAENVDHANIYESRSLWASRPLKQAGVAVFLNQLVNSRYGEVLRVKGLLDIQERPGRPALVHGVQQRFHGVEWLDRWPDDVRGSRLVIIGSCLKQAAIEREFDDLCLTPAPESGERLYEFC